MNVCSDCRLAARGLTGRKGKRGSVGGADSSSEDGNDSHPPSITHVPSPSPGGGPGIGSREETSDRISKEKQKFFRLSAFYARQGGAGTGVGRGVRDASSGSSSSSSSAVSYTHLDVYKRQELQWLQ